MLQDFLRTYPDDGLVPVARAYLALALMSDDGAGPDEPTDGGAPLIVDERAVQEQIRALEKVPRGTTGDLVAVVRARWARLHGDPGAALVLLEPRVGKGVDPIVRALFQEELVAATMDAGKQFEAIAYMSTWLAQTTEEDRERTRARIIANVARLGKDDLLRALDSMRVDPVHAGYSDELLRIIVYRLARIALEKNDAELARELMSPDAGPVLVGGDAGLALAELAGTRTGLNVVEGRTIGLLLPTELPALRDEAASVLRGVMWALGLPRGIRGVLTAPAQDAGTQPQADARGSVTGGGARSPGVSQPRASASGSRTLSCPRPAYVPNEVLDRASEPNAGEGDEDDSALDGGVPRTDHITLVIRDDAGDPAKNRESLLELTGLGASVVIAALDPATSGSVLAWSREHDVPVILLAAPKNDAPPGDFGFVLGTPRTQVLAALKDAVPELGEGKLAPIIDESDRPFIPAHGGTLPPFSRVEEPVSCDVTSDRAGEPRFPIAKWQHDGFSSWLVTGSPACARDVVTELAMRGGPHGVVALGLDAATDLDPGTRLPPGLRAITASAGAVPQGPVGEPPSSELRRFAAAFGAPPDWWTALGRDAATIARLAVMPQRLGETSSPDGVAALRDAVRAGIGRAEARLWTTDAHGWGGTHAMPREVCVMDLGATR
jgi:hypothetical protein